MHDMPSVSGLLLVVALLLLCRGAQPLSIFGGGSRKPKPAPGGVGPSDKDVAAAANPQYAVEASTNVEEVILKQKKEAEEDGMDTGEGGSGEVRNKTKKEARDKIEGSKEYDPITELPKNKTMRIAFCLTGQLARLELASKLKNIFIVNSQLGHTAHLFILLDDNVKDIHQTFWNYDYSKNLFSSYNKSMLEQYMERKKQTFPDLRNGRFNYWVRLEKPGQPYFQIVGGMIPVESKKIVNVDYEREHGLLGSGDGVEPASQRFQNNMRWLGGLRDCVRWVMQVEFEQKMFYDVVVRLRDDTLAFGKWKFYQERYLGALTSARVGSFRGVNDHNFVIDRRWADILFRGLTEDYYFNSTFEKVMWGNPESRIYMIATANNIPIKNATVCEEPLIPLRGPHNDTHWLLHNQYRDNLLAECGNRKQRRKDNCICPPSWLRTLHHGTIAVDLKSPDSTSKGEQRRRGRRS